MLFQNGLRLFRDGKSLPPKSLGFSTDGKMLRQKVWGFPAEGKRSANWLGGIFSTENFKKTKNLCKKGDF